MKFKKFIPVTLMSLLCLTSCGKESYYGSYEFLLGKQGEGEVRVGLKMVLTDEKVPVEIEDPTTHTKVTKDFEKFNVSADLGSMLGEVGFLSELEMDIPDSLSGYYEVLDQKDPNYGNKMSVGFILDESIGIDIPDDIIRNLLVTYVNSSAVTLQVPVSIVDLQMQLSWYGTYIDFDPYVKERIHSFEDIKKYLVDIIESLKFYEFDKLEDKPLPGVHGSERFGTHPVFDLDNKIDEIYEMNDLYAGYFSNTIVYKNNGGVPGEVIGSIYARYEESKLSPIDRHFYYCPLSSEVDIDHEFNCFIKKYNTESNRYDTPKLVELDLVKNDNYFVNRVKLDGEEIEIDYDNFYQEPFIFRDFHDIKIQLNKE